MKETKEAKQIERSAQLARDQDSKFTLQEENCVDVLQDLNDRIEEIASYDDDNDIVVPNNLESQKQFCKKKTYCAKTGKYKDMFGISWTNPTKCNKITQRYSKMKNIHNKMNGGSNKRIRKSLFKKRIRKSSFKKRIRKSLFKKRIRKSSFKKRIRKSLFKKRTRKSSNKKQTYTDENLG